MDYIGFTNPSVGLNPLVNLSGLTFDSLGLKLDKSVFPQSLHLPDTWHQISQPYILFPWHPGSCFALWTVR